jgi:hypothetical protein
MYVVIQVATDTKLDRNDLNDQICYMAVPNFADR